jgi:hypothetical protein
MVRLSSLVWQMNLWCVWSFEREGANHLCKCRNLHTCMHVLSLMIAMGISAVSQFKNWHLRVTGQWFTRMFLPHKKYLRTHDTCITCSGKRIMFPQPQLGGLWASKGRNLVLIYCYISVSSQCCFWGSLLWWGGVGRQEKKKKVTCKSMAPKANGVAKQFGVTVSDWSGGHFNKRPPPPPYPNSPQLAWD